MPAVILSPHLDDAVLSCWHVLTAPGEVAVINVFAGVPGGLAVPAWWDEYTGATDSPARVGERLEEDRRALAVAGRAAVNLDFLDKQYRRAAQPVEPITEQIERLLPSGARIYAPAAFAGHPDHALVRAAAFELRGRGFDVSVYADLPHANLRGWPSWVTGKRAPASRDLVGVQWEHVLAGTEAMPPTVHRLDTETHARKLGAVRMYATQLQALEELAGRSLTEFEALGYEVDWATASPDRETGRAARRC